MTKIVGFKILQGVSKKTGKQQDAVIFHCINETPRDAEFIGHEVLDQYVSGTMARAFFKIVTGDEYNTAACLGKKIRFLYGKSGFLDDIEYIKG